MKACSACLWERRLSVRVVTDRDITFKEFTELSQTWRSDCKHSFRRKTSVLQCISRGKQWLIHSELCYLPVCFIYLSLEDLSPLNLHFVINMLSMCVLIIFLLLTQKQRLHKQWLRHLKPPSDSDCPHFPEFIVNFWHKDGLVIRTVREVSDTKAYCTM